jgi:hypothetical protein
VDTWGAPLYGDPCRECGFTWATGQAGSVALMRDMPDAMEDLVSVANWLAAIGEAEPAGVVMLHSERGAMELADVVASNAHDVFHHRWDVARILHVL